MGKLAPSHYRVPKTRARNLLRTRELLSHWKVRTRSLMCTSTPSRTLLIPKSKGFKEQKHPMGHPDPGGGFAVCTQPSKAMKTPRDGQFLPGRSQLRASTSCHPQVHSKAAFSLCPDRLQHPRLSAAPTRPGQRVSLPTHWAFLSASKGTGHTGSCTGSDPRSAWTASHHESSPWQVPWEKHKVRTSTY